MGRFTLRKIPVLDFSIFSNSHWHVSLSKNVGNFRIRFVRVSPQHHCVLKWLNNLSNGQKPQNLKHMLCIWLISCACIIGNGPWCPCLMIHGNIALNLLPKFQGNRIRNKPLGEHWSLCVIVFQQHCAL